MKTLKTMAYFEPGSNGSPACLPVWMAIKEFNSESRATIKYGPELFPPAKLTLNYREGRKETKEVLIGGRYYDHEGIHEAETDKNNVLYIKK